MSLEVKNNVEIQDNTKQFNSVADSYTQDNWEFRYITQDINGNDQTRTGQEIDTDEDNYPIGTIFFNSKPSSVFLSSTIKNVYVDSTPPVFISENIQYMVFEKDYGCSFIFESDTPLDIAQLIISCGGEILYKTSRQEGQTDSGFINDITINRNGNRYTVNFSVDKSYDVESLNENQLTIIVWDIAANYVSHTTAGTWMYFKSGIDSENIKPLIIEFYDCSPADKLIKPGIEGETWVKVINPNRVFYDIIPTVKLTGDSLGIIDRNTVVFYRNSTDSSGKETDMSPVLIFKISGIKQGESPLKNCMVIVDAWIDIDNDEIMQTVKDETFVENSIGPFIVMGRGRKYNFGTYTPKFTVDDNYGNFIMFCQDMLNSCHYDLDDSERISILEKIAKINDFNDVNRLESPLLNSFKEQFNFEITPDFDKYLYFMNNRPSEGSEQNV